MALDNLCDNCNVPVKSRKPSITGRHYCSKNECQAAKQRSYRRDKGIPARGEQGATPQAEKLQAEIETLKLSFVSTRDLLFAVRIGATRKSCFECGRTDGFPNFPHPHLETREPCYELVADAPDARKIPRMILDEVWVD